MFTSSQLELVSDGSFCPQLFTHTFVYRSRHRSSVDRTVCKKCVGRGGQKPSLYMVIMTIVHSILIVRIIATSDQEVKSVSVIWQFDFLFVTDLLTLELRWAIRLISECYE